MASVLEQAAAALAAMPLEIDVAGGGTWAPSRSPKKDYSKWGVWEAWQFCRIGKINECLVGAIPTEDWIAWNSETGQQLSCGGGPKAQWKAEVLAVSQNQGRPTRVVDFNGTAVASSIKLREVERLLGPAVAEFEAQRAAQLGATLASSSV